MIKPQRKLNIYLLILKTNNKLSKHPCILNNPSLNRDVHERNSNLLEEKSALILSICVSLGLGAIRYFFEGF